MGVCFREGSKRLFKANLTVQANANASIRIVLSGVTVATKTADSSGVATFEIKKKGTYTVYNGSLTSANVTVSQNKGSYSVDITYATITVQANANVTVVLKKGSTQISSKGSGSNGVVTFNTVGRGTYTVTHSSLLSQDITVVAGTSTYSATMVYVRPVTNLYAGGYSTGQAMVYWDGETSDSYRTGSAVRYATNAYPTSVSAGTQAFMGTDYQRTSFAVNASTTGRGFLQGIGSGTLYWSRFNYVLVNGRYYYSAYTTSGRAYYTYASYSGKQTFTGGSSWTVPTGVRSITVGVVGGGGSGGADDSTYYRANGGGGGGYVNSKTISVTPGQIASFSIGQGGAAVTNAYGNRSNKNGNAGGTTTFSVGGSSVSASGGAGGGHGGGAQMPYGGNGGAGGGAGGSSTGGAESGASGGNGGSNGGNGESVTYGSTAQGGTGAGQAAVTFDGTIYSGGGGGGRGGYGSAGSGGSPGGGAGGAPGSIAGSGSNGTGAGGGGAGTLGNTTSSGAWTSSGAGGCGTVIIKY